MTRETKAGLVVSCSFLCLVGAVITLKMRQQTADQEQVAHADDPPAPEKTQQPAQVSSIPSPLEKDPDHLTKLAKAQTGAPAPGEGQSASDPPDRTKKSPENERDPKHANANGPSTELVPPLPIPPVVPPGGPSPTEANGKAQPSIPEVTPPAPPAGVPPLPGPGVVTTSADTRPEGATKPEEHEPGKTAKPGEKTHSSDESEKEKHARAGVSPPPEPAPLPTGPPISGLPLISGPIPAVGAEKGKKPADEADVPGSGHGKGEKHLPDPRESPVPAVSAVPPLPPGPPELKSAELPTLPGSGRTTTTGELPSPVPPPPGPGGTPLPPIAGNGQMPDDKPFRPSTAPTVGRPESLGPLPGPEPVPAPPVGGSATPAAPVPAPLGGATTAVPSPVPAPIGSPTSRGDIGPKPIPAPIPVSGAGNSPVPIIPQSNFIPNAAPREGEPPLATPSATPIDGSKPKVTLERLQPIPANGSLPEPAALAGAPISGPAPISATVMPIRVVSEPAPIPAPIPAPLPQTPVGAPVMTTTPMSLPPSLPAAIPTRPLATTVEPSSTQVVSYEELRRSVRAGDTFQTLSTEKYGSDRYADALRAWNLNHPRASIDLQRGLLVPGDKVFFPPASQLDQHYASFIPAEKAVTPRPSGAVQTGFTTAAAPVTAIKYMVAADESIESVVRRTFGTSDRTADVLRLNSTLRAGQILPKGTMVELPADAKVPLENEPAPR